MTRGFHIGQNALNGQQVYLSSEELEVHSLIVGGTGRGKSKYIENLFRHLLLNGYGGAILDPHGFLIQDLIAYASLAGMRDRIIVIDSNDSECSVGLNFLDQRSLDAAALSAQVMRAIAKVFGEADTETKPRLERWLRVTLHALIESGQTLADMPEFLSVSNARFRQSALLLCSNDYVLHEWTGFDALAKRSDRENLIEGPLNRAAKMVGSDQIRRILGQQQSTIDIGCAIECGKIILVNLAPLRVSRECQQMIGILLVDQIINYASTRTKRQAKRPFHVIVDEAAELMSNDVPYALQACRKFGVFMTLCYQTLAQIKRIPGYAETVMSNTDCKIVFKVSREDSEELVGEMFAGGIRGDVVKDELHRTMLVPKETVRQIISQSESLTEGESESDSYGESSSDGFGSTCVTVSGSSFSEHSAFDRSFFVAPAPQSESHGLTSTESRGDSSSFSVGKSSSRSSSRSESRSRGVTKTVVPFYEYIRESELSSRQFYSIEEIKEKYISWIMTQPQRHAQLKIGDRKAIPILTAFVDEVRVRDKDKAKVVALSNLRYARPHEIVDRMIEERRTRLIDQLAARVSRKEKDIEADRWQVLNVGIVPAT